VKRDGVRVGLEDAVRQARDDLGGGQSFNDLVGAARQ